MTSRILVRVLLRLIVLVGVIVLAANGGYNLLWLILLPLVAWDTFRTLKPAPARRPADRFTASGDYRVVLQVPGGRPVLVIREIRRTTGLGLLEAKQLVDDAPVVVAEALSEESAELVADRLRAAGARAVAAPIGEM